MLKNRCPLFHFFTRHCNCYGGLEDVIIDNDDEMLKMSYDGGYFMKNSPCSGKKHWDWRKMLINNLFCVADSWKYVDVLISYQKIFISEW